MVVDDEGMGLTIYLGNDTTWVGLEYTDQHLGGRRPWFQCPACGRRCALLYEQHEKLSCRVCRGLAYRSQRCNREDRIRLKAQKIRQRLGGSANLLIPFPERPKGMPRRTYRYWRDKGLEAERAMYEAMWKQLRAMERVGDIPAGA